MPIKCEVVSVPAINKFKNYYTIFYFVKPYYVSIKFLFIKIDSNVLSVYLLIEVLFCSYCILVSIAFFVIALKSFIYSFIYLSILNMPNFNI